MGLRRFGVGRSLAQAARGFLRGFENSANWHLGTNGELETLRRLGTTDVTTVFDVGANVGDWTLAAAESMPAAHVHAFEPVPATATELRRRTATVGSRVTVNEVALGAVAEERLLSIGAGRSSQVSLLGDDDSPGAESVPITVVTGDGYCAAKGIERIGFLKVDAEGTDHLVLEGFDDMLSTRRVDVVQFEYGPWALTTHFLLRDFYRLLDGHGYTTGKLYPRGVAFGDYDPELDDFRGLNFVAVSNRRPDLEDLLREQ